MSRENSVITVLQSLNSSGDVSNNGNSMSGKLSIQRAVSVRVGCPERLWMPNPWRHSGPGWMGSGSEQPDLVLDPAAGNPACSTGLGT